MACYISSNNERFYAAVESNYGVAAAIASARRFPAVKLAARQTTEAATRRDKTGTRTFRGLPEGVRRQTTFEIQSYMSSWNSPAQPPLHDPLFQGVMGSVRQHFAGANSAAGSTVSQITFAAPHGLAVGQAITFGSEMRFVASVVSNVTVALNAPFSVGPTGGSPIGRASTYRPGEELPSVTLFDYWSPATAVQRILPGSAFDSMELSVNGDFHEFVFRGAAKDLMDNVSFEAGQAGLATYPVEPVLSELDYAIVPGHLGQAWLGAVPERMYTITSARFAVRNNLDLRDREFGGSALGCTVAGEREVSLEFSLYERDDAATAALYQAARQRSPISVMFQLGQQAGQLLSVWMPAVIPEVPEFDDGQTRLEWRFSSSRAQGSANDEVFLAVG